MAVYPSAIKRKNAYAMKILTIVFFLLLKEQNVIYRESTYFVIYVSILEMQRTLMYCTVNVLVISYIHNQQRFTRREDSWNSFLLEAESIPGL
jgi:hypothetical protein